MGFGLSRVRLRRLRLRGANRSQMEAPDRAEACMAEVEIVQWGETA